MKKSRLARLVERFDGQCYFCKKEVDYFNPERRPTRDHLTPRSRGGSNYKTNIVLACNKCNHEKGNMTEQEYNKLKFLIRTGYTRKGALHYLRCEGVPV